jgi:hypothetical protein
LLPPNRDFCLIFPLFALFWGFWLFAAFGIWRGKYKGGCTPKP